jgi:hypothetical protein
MDYNDEKAPEPEKRKPLKEFTFTRTLQNGNTSTPLGNINNDLKGEKNDKNELHLNLSLSMILYEREIEFNVKGTKDNFKVPSIQYLKIFPFEELKGLNKFFSLLKIDKIFEFLQNSFEKNYDAIEQGEEVLKIHLMVNVMEIMTEEITIDLPIISLSNNDELENLKETIKVIEEEKNSFKIMINKLNTTIQELQKKFEENKNLSLNEEKQIETKIEEKEKKLTKNLEDKDIFHQNKENELQAQIDKNKDEIQSQIDKNKDELQTKIDENKNELQEEFINRLEEKERILHNYIDKLNSQMKEVKEVEKYVRDKLMNEEDDEEGEEIDKYSCTRSYERNEDEEEEEEEIEIDKYPCTSSDERINLTLSMILLEEKIKFKIKEIKNNLIHNPNYYEVSFNIKNFENIGTYYKEKGGIKALFNFLRDLLKEKKDNILIKKNEVVVKVKFPFGAKDEEISLIVKKKEKRLEQTLNDIDLTLKDINQANINNEKNLEETKKEFKRKLLENVYPVGTYYWSQNSIDPGNLFGGTWKKINGYFIFASDSSHSVGSTGGKERVTLSSYEIPSHSHSYYRLTYESYKRCSNADTDSNGGYRVVCYKNDGNYEHSESTSSCGGSGSHENMPPYLTANCWRRIS